MALSRGGDLLEWRPNPDGRTRSIVVKLQPPDGTTSRTLVQLEDSILYSGVAGRK